MRYQKFILRQQADSHALITRIKSHVSLRIKAKKSFIKTQLSQDPRDLEGMNEVRLSGEPFLAIMHLRREDVGTLQPREIDLWVVLEEAVGDVVESEHPGFEKTFGSEEL